MTPGATAIVDRVLLRSAKRNQMLKIRPGFSIMKSGRMILCRCVREQNKPGMPRIPGLSGKKSDYFARLNDLYADLKLEFAVVAYLAPLLNWLITDTDAIEVPLALDISIGAIISSPMPTVWSSIR